MDLNCAPNVSPMTQNPTCWFSFVMFRISWVFSKYVYLLQIEKMSSRWPFSLRPFISKNGVLAETLAKFVPCDPKSCPLHPTAWYRTLLIPVLTYFINVISIIVNVRERKTNKGSGYRDHQSWTKFLQFFIWLFFR